MSDPVRPAAKSLQSCLTLCDPIDGCPPRPAVPGILQAGTLEWAAISFSNAWKWKVKVKSISPVRDSMDCSPPGSSIHGIFQARVLEWGCKSSRKRLIPKIFPGVRDNCTDLWHIYKKTWKSMSDSSTPTPAAAKGEKSSFVLDRLSIPLLQAG